MRAMKVAVVSRDADVRLAAARAFDAAPANWSVDLFEDVPEDADVVVLGEDVPAGEERDSGARATVRFERHRPHAVVARLHELAGADRGRCYVVTALGGGTGATSVALHLAAASAERTRTCYVDLNPHSPALDRFGLDRERTRTWADVDTTPDSLLRSALPMAGGFRALLAPPCGVVPPSGHERAPDAEMVERARAAFESVVVDVSAACCEPGLLDAADASVLVMAATVPGARRARAVVDRVPDARWLVVANRAGPGGEVTRSGLERALGRRIAVELPTSAALRDAEDLGELVSAPWNRWRRRVVRVLRALEAA